MPRIPINTHEPDDFFSHQALELTFRLLHNNNPGLADAIKNTLSHTHIVPYEIIQGAHTGEMHFNAEIYHTLSAYTIGKIVSALTTLGENALANQNMPATHLHQLRKLIADWVQLTEWVLNHTTPEKSAYH